jgi:hypothetical protein
MPSRMKSSLCTYAPVDVPVSGTPVQYKVFAFSPIRIPSELLGGHTQPVQ